MFASKVSIRLTRASSQERKHLKHLTSKAKTLVKHWSAYITFRTSIIGSYYSPISRHYKIPMVAVVYLASHAGIFAGARFSSLPTVCGEGWKTSSPKNACVGGYCVLRGSTSPNLTNNTDIQFPVDSLLMDTSTRRTTRVGTFLSLSLFLTLYKTRRRSLCQWHLGLV